MGIISIKSTDNLFWLGRYVERVFTTLKMFSECYDVLIDVDENAYVAFLQKLGIPNTYAYKADFITNFLFDENNPNSVLSTFQLPNYSAYLLPTQPPPEALSDFRLTVKAHARFM